MYTTCPNTVRHPTTRKLLPLKLTDSQKIGHFKKIQDLSFLKRGITLLYHKNFRFYSRFKQNVKKRKIENF